jgi:hypothetical protein
MVRARLQPGGNQIGCPRQRYDGSKALLRAAGVDDRSGNGATGVSARFKAESCSGASSQGLRRAQRTVVAGATWR